MLGLVAYPTRFSSAPESLSASPALSLASRDCAAATATTTTSSPSVANKRRSFCPPCGARRMAQTAAHLVDHAIPPHAYAPVGSVTADPSTPGTAHATQAGDTRATDRAPSDHAPAVDGTRTVAVYSLSGETTSLISISHLAADLVLAALDQGKHSEKRCSSTLHYWHIRLFS